MPTAEALFWAAHTDLPREAPGSTATTRLLLGLAGPLPSRPRVVDIGCGTGPATVLLARETGGEVTGVDLHEPFLARLRADAQSAGLGDTVRTLAASMDDLPLPDGCADLLWAEGSAYVMGLDAALRAWRRMLAPGGVLVLTEAEWTTPHPAAGARAFWDAGYPAMRTTGGNITAAQDAGWTVAATYLLPESDWDAYYTPLAARIAELRTVHPGHVDVLDEVGAEIGLRRAHGTDYGYTGYVLRPAPDRMSGGAVSVGAMTAIATFSLVALDCPDPLALARFYGAITGWEIERADDDWVQLGAPGGGPTLAFQLVPDHRPPQWPGHEQPQQAHVDFDVPDLDAAEERILAVGARKHDVQPRPDGFRVYLDPAGHPFCLVRA